MQMILSPGKRTKKIMAIVAMLIITLSLLLLSYAKSPVDDRGVTATVYVPKGTSFIEIVNILDRAGMVNNRLFFFLLAFSKGIAGHIKAGEYELVSSMTPGEITDKLARGDIKVYWVTIPEDYTLKQIADLLVANHLVDEKTFLAVTTDPAFLASLNIHATSAEGYLYPDTYQFNRTMTTREIVKILVNQFWKKVTPPMLKRAHDLGMTTTEFVTLASLIGKESGHKEEKTQISAVFHNRLKKGMKLQSDPTAIYRLDQYSSIVRRKHLENDTPYNTYKRRGLPPGPIANPGIDSLLAALSPAPVNYLYFVSNNDGTHKFSSNLAAHAHAVLKYQIKRKKQ
jgi:UPF0755 protein